MVILMALTHQNETKTKKKGALRAEGVKEKLMCMSKVTWTIEPPKGKYKSPYKWLKGYKVFQVVEHHVGGTTETVTRFPHQHYNHLGSNADYVSVPLNEVLKAKVDERYPNINAMSDNRLVGSYPTGFHVFPSPMAAALYQPIRSDLKVFDVEYRKVVAEGEHALFTKFPTDCVVALELRVIGPHDFNDDPKHAKRVKKLRKDGRSGKH